MKKSNHNQFILTSITKILEEMISACRGVGDGIETYAVYDYILQSTFLKMTGAQEQKFKCICWELATNDYEYRREFLSGGEKGMSNYNDKKNVYRDLVKQIKKFDTSFNIKTFFNEDSKKNIIDNSVYQRISDLLENNHLKISLGNKFLEFTNTDNKIQKQHFLVPPKPKDENIILFSKELQDIYDKLYKYRNRCAHNTLSYQQNLPTLDTLRREDYKYENYFVYFSILILIDEIMMSLYQKYLEVLE